jgi:hypothetical protein
METRVAHVTTYRALANSTSILWPLVFTIRQWCAVMAGLMAKVLRFAKAFAGSLIGHFYIHNGDDPGFVCERG